MTDPVTTILEKERVLEVVRLLFIETDRKDWAAVRRCFAPEVRFQMTSGSGGAPRLITPDTITREWDEGLQHVPVLHHQIGNELVTLNEQQAHVFCYGIALHYAPTARNGTTRRYVGTYDLDLEKGEEGWNISGFRFTLKFLDGNRDLS